MALRKAKIGSVTVTGVRAEISLDNGGTWKDLPGIYDINTSGGEPATETYTPIDAATITRSGRRSSQSLALTAADLSWMARYKNIHRRFDSEDFFLFRLVKPEVTLFTGAGAGDAQAAIDAQTGVVTFSGPNAPDMLRGQFGRANLIWIGNVYYVIDEVIDAGQGVPPNVTVETLPMSDIAASDFELTRAGGYYGPEEITGGNSNLALGNAGEIQNNYSFMLGGRGLDEFTPVKGQA